MKFFKNLIGTLILFLFVFSPALKYLPLVPSKLIIITALIFSILIQSSFFIHSRFKLFIYIFFWFIYTLTRVALSVEFSYLVQQFFFIFEYFLGAYLLANVYCKFFNHLEIIRMLLYSGLFQSIIILSMAGSDSIYQLLLSFYREDFYSYMIDLNDRYFGFRGFGLASSVTYDLGVLLCMYVPLTSLFKIRRSYKILTISIISLAAILTARTALVLLLFLLFNQYIRKRFRLFNYIKLIFFLIFLSIIVSVIIDYNRDNGFINFVLEIFINYKEEGELRSISTDALQKEYKVNIKELLLGAGIFTTSEGGYYGNTDVGYLRHMLFGGIISILFLLGFYKILYSSVSKTTYSSIISTLLIMLLIVQFKGDILMGSGQVGRFFFFIICTLNIQTWKDYLYSMKNLGVESAHTMIQSKN